MSNRLVRSVGLLGLLLAVQAGCGGREGITAYEAPKQKANQVAMVPPQPPRPTRMLAAIVPQGEEAWFFKVMGSDEPVAAVGETFESFVAGLRFAEGKPQWDLPEGWKEAAASPLRFATLQIPGADQKLEMSVTVLSKPAEDEEAYVLANVNRWRRQLNLRALDAGELAGQTKRIQVAGVEATLIDYLGTSSGGGMPPFAGGGGGQPAADAVLSYDTPEGWQKGRVGGLRKAAFTVADGEQEAEITVIDLAAGAGDLLSNVNRWRKQVLLDETTGQALAEELEVIKLGEVQGQYVKLIGPAGADPGAILGVIAIRGDKSWFVKLSGDAKLAEREEERFKAFVRSVRFN